MENLILFVTTVFASIFTINSKVIVATQYLPTIIYTETATYQPLPVYTDTPTPTQIYVQPPIVDTPAQEEYLQLFVGVDMFTPLPVMPTYEDLYNPIYITNTPSDNTVQYSGEMDLDQVWGFVSLGGVDLSPCVYPLPTPFATWDMAVLAANMQEDRHSSDEISIPASTVSYIMSGGGGYFPTDGNIRMPENSALFMLADYYQSGRITACKNQNGFPDVYGLGVQSFLNDIYNNYKE